MSSEDPEAADLASVTTPVVLGTKPADAPIACTLEPGSVPDRLAEWQRILDRARARTIAADGTVRVELGDEVDLAELSGLVVSEQQCCAFFSFAITVDARGIGLEVAAPEAAADIAASLFGPRSS